MEHEELKNKYETAKKQKLWGDLIFKVLAGGMIGSLIAKLPGTLIGIILGYIFSYTEYKNSIQELEEELDDRNISIHK